MRLDTRNITMIRDLVASVFLSRNQPDSNDKQMITELNELENILGFFMFKQEFCGFGRIRNTMLDHIMDDFRIAASLINCFHSNRFSHLNDDNKENLANEMKLRLNKPNKLESYIKN